MKAVIYTEYGPPEVLKLQEIDMPTPKDDEILVKIHATSITFGDMLVRNLRKLTPSNFTMPAPLWLPTRIAFGFWKPKTQILGAEFAGEIEAAGKSVTRFKVGDQVFGYRGQSMGAYAEYLCMPEDSLVTTKPTNMSYEEAVTIPYGAIMALPLLKKANIQPGQKVLIIGASGSIGSQAVQLAKYFGAEVTGVCGTQRVEMVKALGADKVIDYTQEDFTQSSETYDLIFDILGKSDISKCKPILSKSGTYLLASFKMKHLLQMLWTSRFSSRKVICALSPEDIDDLNFVRDLAEAGDIKAVIDKCYPLDQAADAHRYVESGQKRGEVILSLSPQPA